MASIMQLLKILLTVTETSVTVVRHFSVKGIKTAMRRSSMSSSRVNAVAVLSFEKAATRNLNRSNIVEKFRLMLWFLAGRISKFQGEFRRPAI